MLIGSLCAEEMALAIETAQRRSCSYLHPNPFALLSMAWKRSATCLLKMVETGCRTVHLSQLQVCCQPALLTRITKSDVAGGEPQYPKIRGSSDQCGSFPARHRSGRSRWLFLPRGCAIIWPPVARRPRHQPLHCPNFVCSRIANSLYLNEYICWAFFAQLIPDVMRSCTCSACATKPQRRGGCCCFRQP